MNITNTLGAALAAMTIATAPAEAVFVNFASFATIPGGGQFYWQNSTGGPSGDYFTTPSAGPAYSRGFILVKFSFIGAAPPGLAAAVTNVTARFVLSASATNSPAVLLSSPTRLVQNNIDNGVFEFLSTTPITIGSGPCAGSYAPGATLLAGSFNQARISGPPAGSIARFSTTVGNPVTYITSFCSFAPGPAQFVKTGVTPGLSAVPGVTALQSFDPAATGTFATSVPEPAHWALLITGFGLAGTAQRLTLRRRAAIA